MLLDGLMEFVRSVAASDSGFPDFLEDVHLLVAFGLVTRVVSAVTGSAGTVRIPTALFPRRV